LQVAEGKFSEVFSGARADGLEVVTRGATGAVEWLDSVEEFLLYLSVVTLAEIRRGLMPFASGRRRSLLEACLDIELEARFAARNLPIDSSVADTMTSLRNAQYSSEGNLRSQPATLARRFAGPVTARLGQIPREESILTTHVWRL
jgi:predicted nucleic acid-binding protein